MTWVSVAEVTDRISNPESVELVWSGISSELFNCYQFGAFDIALNPSLL